MAKIKRKGVSGQARNYITRTQAVRKLQVTLPDFRRLCIFKGIYPREPRNKKKASKSSSQSTTFYYTKDIQYLLHEPLLAKFREQKALSKKIARSLGRNEVGDAARLEKHRTPKITLDHIIIERYPTFVDAIRDLDDALSLLFLFANLPSSPTVPPKIIARCQRLCHEFEHYLIITHSLQKSFLSIKGIYYQATVQGQDVMWLVPYKFVQKITGEVDYRIMGTFVDFYATLLGFVNFRLYMSVGLVYPPKFDPTSDERGGELAAFTLEGRKVGEASVIASLTTATTLDLTQTSNSKDVQAQVDSIAQLPEPEPEVNGSEFVDEEGENNDAIDRFEPAAPEADILHQPEFGSNEAALLFSDCTFFISREAPRHPIELLLRAFGCKRIGWNFVFGDGAFTNDEADPRVTHQIVDRPPVNLTTDSEEQTPVNNQTPPSSNIFPGRTYVQPQWVWDSVNEGRLLRPDLYAPGATLPPHLSPWITPSHGQYDPRASLAEQEREGESDIAAEEALEKGREIGSELSKNADVAATPLGGGMDVAGSDEEEEEEDGDEDTKAVEEGGEQDDNFSASKADEFASFEDDEMTPLGSDSGEEETELVHQKELEAEATGMPFSTAKGARIPTTNKLKSGASKKRALKQKKEEEELERQKMMMSRKKRKLFEKMQYSNNKKDAEAEKLRSKRRKIEKIRR